MQVEQIGKTNVIEPFPATMEQIASICYTSVSFVITWHISYSRSNLEDQGTTNHPKGAILKHGNLGLTVQSYLYGTELAPDDVVFSYLPLAHIYEVCTYILFVA